MAMRERSHPAATIPAGVLIAASLAACDPPPEVSPICDLDDPELVGCFDFEGDVSDQSPSSLVVDARMVAFGEGRNGRALTMTEQSAVHIADAPARDFTAVTVAMWIRLDDVPLAGSVLFDVGGLQVGVVADDPIVGVSCGWSADAVEYAIPMARLGQWYHVACTASAESLVVYVDEALEYFGTDLSPPLGFGSLAGGTIGNSSELDRGFIGQIDELRIWSRALRGSEICAAAGLPC